MDGVTILVPCYNDGRYLREAIGSVFAFRSPLAFEVLLIDDGSDCRETLAVIEDMRDAYGDRALRVIRLDRNRGLGAARNVGLREASFEYIFPLDADNTLGAPAADDATGICYFACGHRILSTCSQVALVYNEGRVFGAYSGRWPLLPYDEKTILCFNMVDAHAMYRRSEALRIGGYCEDRDLPEDWILAVGLLNERYRQARPAFVERIHGPLFNYRLRTDGTSLVSRRPRDSMVRGRALLMRQCPEIYAKHFPGKHGDALVRAIEQHSFEARHPRRAVGRDDATAI